MKRFFYAITIAITALSLSSCESLDIPPKNIMTDDDISTKEGITAYMAGMYNRLPMDDFNVSQEGSLGGYFNWDSSIWPMVSTGETVNSKQKAIYIPQKVYWAEGYKIIRNANHLISFLPATMEDYESLIAEARFLRAYVYFQLVKRYGGVPILDHEQEWDADESKFWIPRDSHEKCYDFILEDLEYAMKHMTDKQIKGRANRYVAAAMKSRVALFAGSIAKYGGQFTWKNHAGDITLCGIPSNRANDYFKMAWDAAKTLEGKYSLYEEDTNLEENYANIFAKAGSSPESIFIRQYDYTSYVHSFDNVYCPPRMTTSNGGRYNVTLDWVELFEGLPIDESTGRLKTVDNDNNYIVYDNATQLFSMAEPRLKGSILLPGHTYKGVELDIRRGIVKENIDPTTTKISKFIIDDGKTIEQYSKNEFFKNNVLETTDKVDAQTPYEIISNGKTIKLNINGMDGPSNGGTENTLTGFHGRKWLNLNMTSSATNQNESTQPWIDLRYAEVLLNRAEAALELYQNGETSYQGSNLQTDAYECINKIRKRAGASLLNSASELSTDAATEKGKGKGGFIYAPNKGLQLIRIERYKELAFEHKLYWDLCRWFTFDKQIYNYHRRMLNPFLFAYGATINEAGNPSGKLIYDTRICERADNNLTFETRFYYTRIPDDEIKANPLLEQNNE